MSVSRHLYVVNDADTPAHDDADAPGTQPPASLRSVGQASEPYPLRTDAKVAHQCVFDVLWCTQYRLPVLEGQVEIRLREVITAVLAEKEVQLIDIDIRPNRVRLVVEASPQLGVHRLVKALKFESAQVLRNEFPSLRSRLPSLWTRSYLVATVGDGFSPEMIEHYVDQQKGR